MLKKTQPLKKMISEMDYALRNLRYIAGLEKWNILKSYLENNFLNDIKNNNIVKDNPVPSIDFNFLQECILYDMSFEQKKEACNMLEKLKQNGVETDKEQPKPRCQGACENGQHYDCSNYCTRYGGRVQG